MNDTRIGFSPRLLAAIARAVSAGRVMAWGVRITMMASTAGSSCAASTAMT